MYPIPPSETLVQTKTCRHCSASFPVTDKDLEFYEKISPVFNWKRYSIPSPTLCPDCRQQRRLSFRNERKIYKRKCQATWRDIISMYSPDKPYPVYHYSVWWSDKWDPLRYGRDFDLEKSFFEQFATLSSEIPHASTEVNAIENSEYSNCVGMLKDCYLLFASWTDERCLYWDNLERSKNCVDCTFIYDCEECYGISTAYNCYKVYNSFNCRDCSISSLLTNCLNCTHCFACAGVQNKKYHILNIPYSPEDYQNILSDPEKVDDILKEYEILRWSIPVKYIDWYQIEESTGDYLYNCKNLFRSYITENSKNCTYITFCRKTENCKDFDFFWDPWEWCYESLTCWYSSTLCLFSISCINTVYSLIYCYSCYSCQNCFGCIGLRNKSYCILNKQYTKEEYEALVPRIIEHMMIPHHDPLLGGEGVSEWGEFFPSSLSPFGYNETVAMEYYPLTRNQISESRDQNGKNIFHWSDYEAPFPKVEKIIPADKLPDDISQIPDDILNWAIECEVTKKPFRIIKQELEFYRKHHLPISRRHPDQRHLDRMALRNPRKLFERKCDKCRVEMITTYAPERPEKVYCWACYDMEVLW